MKNIMTALLCLLMALVAKGQNLSPEQVARVESCVRNYCSLLERFSASPEGAELLPEVQGCCENPNVQTFDDLSNNKDVGHNSVPLQKYLTKVTLGYDNQIKVKHYDFKYEGIIRQPALSKEMGDIIYALVSVTKTVKGSGLNRKVKLRVCLNVANGKIGGTVSTEYEDPGKMYQDALEQAGKGNVDGAIALLKKCSSYSTYPGRYKAMSVLGKIYYELKDYATAINVLQQCCDEHPLGGIWLTGIYLDKQVPYRLRDRHEALRLLEKYADRKDDEFPDAQLQAAVSLATVYIGDYDLPRNLAKAKVAIDKAMALADECNDTPYGKVVRPVLRMLRYTFMCDSLNISLEEQKKYLIDLDKDIDLDLAEPDYSEARCFDKAGVYLAMAFVYEEEGDVDGAISYVQKAMAEYGNLSNENQRLFFLKDAEKHIGKFYVNSKRFADAFKWYERQAEEKKIGLANWYMYIYYTKDNLQNATSFEKYLYEDHGQKNDEIANKYLITAANNGSLDANKLVSIYFVFQSEKLDVVKLGIKDYLLWYCDRTDYNSVMALNLMSGLVGKIIDDKQYELLDVLKENSSTSGSANFILGLFYDDEKSPYYDPKKCAEYYTKGSKLHNFYCAHFLAYGYLEGTIVEKDTLMAQRLFAEMTDCNYPEAYFALGDIQNEKGNIKEAIEYLNMAYDLGDMFAPAALANMYAQGIGVERNVNKAIKYYEEACARILAHDGEEHDIAEYKEKIRNLREQNPDLTDDSNYIATVLAAVADISKNPEERIRLSEKALSQIFASSQSIVEVVGSNGTAIVAKLNAQDYLLELSTSGSRSTIEILDVKKDTNDKVVSLKLMRR